MTATCTTPDRSLQQRSDALATANAIRHARAQLKRRVKTGDARIADVVRNPPAYVQTMKVYDLLLAVPALGPVKINKLLRHHRISPSKNLGGLSARQRDDLATALESR